MDLLLRVASGGSLPLAASKLESEGTARLVLREPHVASEPELVAKELRMRDDRDIDGSANAIVTRRRSLVVRTNADDRELHERKPHDRDAQALLRTSTSTTACSNVRTLLALAARRSKIEPAISACDGE
jgi:hypothetical protein